MGSLQERIAAYAHASANLLAQLNELGSVGIQDSHPCLIVIQASDGAIRFN